MKRFIAMGTLIAIFVNPSGVIPEIATAEPFILNTCLVEKKEAKDESFVTIKGRIIFKGDEKFIEREEIIPNKDAKACEKRGKIFKEDLIIDPKTKGLKNVVIWIGPDDKRGAVFPQERIHPKLNEPAEKTVTVDAPCCQFVPHVSAVRVGQTLKITNSAEIPHNTRFTAAMNGEISPLLSLGRTKEINIAKLEPKMNLATIDCTIHPWMMAWVAIFDHPYYAITNEKGEFEIKMVPKGKFRIFIRHPKGGFVNGKEGAQGELKELNTDLNLGEIIFEVR